MNRFGTRLRTVRESMNLTQEMFGAKLCKYPTLVSKWENGILMPDAEDIPDIARALNVSIQTLFSDEKANALSKAARIAANASIFRYIDMDKSEQILLEGLEIYPDSYILLERLADIYANKGDVEKTRDYLNYLAAAAPYGEDSFLSAKLLGIAYAKSNKPLKAYSQFLSYTSINRTRTQIFAEYLGDCGATEYFDKAFEQALLNLYKLLIICNYAAIDENNARMEKNTEADAQALYELFSDKPLVNSGTTYKDMFAYLKTETDEIKKLPKPPIINDYSHLNIGNSQERKDAFSRRLVIFRKNKKYLQDTFGAALGVYPQTVTKWENGITMPATELLPRIAYLLRLDIQQLYSDKAAQEAVEATEIRKDAYQYFFTEPDKFLQICNDAFKKYPYNPGIISSLCDRYSFNGDIENTLKFYEYIRRIPAVRKQFIRYSSLANAYYVNGRYMKAFCYAKRRPDIPFTKTTLIGEYCDERISGIAGGIAIYSHFSLLYVLAKSSAEEGNKKMALRAYKDLCSLIDIFGNDWLLNYRIQDLEKLKTIMEGLLN